MNKQERDRQRLTKHLFDGYRYSRPYKDFYYPNGFQDQRVHTEYWWSEDLVFDLLKEEKFFGTSSMFKTRELVAKHGWHGVTSLVKGPFSPADIWVPGKAFIEVKYTSYGVNPGFGFTMSSGKGAARIEHFIKGYDRDTQRPRRSYKFYLAVVSDVGKTVSLVDLFNQPLAKRWRYDFTFKYGEPSHDVFLDRENCVLIKENLHETIYKYKQGENDDRSINDKNQEDRKAS